MKKILFSIAALAASSTAFAGGLLTNTNQHAAFLRNPSRQAIIGIEGVYTNPAGVAFMPQGFHLGVTWQAAFQKRQMDVTNPLYGYNVNNSNISRKFEGKAQAPVIPSLQAAYVINDKWSVSANFAVAGGGGKCEFDGGLPMFEELIGGSLVKAGAGYSFNQNLTGEQYFYGLQLGATYKVTDNISVFGGVRGIMANSAYTGAITNIMAHTAAGAVPGAAYLNGVSQHAAAAAQQYAAAAQQYAAAGLATEAAQAAAAAQQYADAAKTAGTGAYLMQTDFNLDCEQSAFGFQPIVGANFKFGKLNIGAKYEFRAKINLENESKNSANVDALMGAYADGAKVRSDIPALFTVGAQYEVTDNVRAMAGVNYYFDKDAKGSATAVSNDTYEITLGAEWDVNEKWTVGLGGQRTKYGFDAEDMQDTNFNISSYGLCVGGAYKFSEKLKLNFGYMHTFYEDHKFTNANGTACNYTRKNDVLGVSLDFKF
ncbi:MAG: outer membrane protein transport protein [Bacteroidaceae bacterium]|nr:outer membrane protein transport protein [Bacteroidaceae bacterium]